MTYLFAAYLSCKDRFDTFVTFEMFSELMKHWELIPINVGGEVAGAIFLNGDHVHVCVLPKFEKRWLTKRLYKMIFVDKLEQYGELFTGIIKGNEIGREFVERCGFRVYDEYANVVIYRLGG